MGKVLQNDYESKLGPAGTQPPKPGLQYDPQTARWKRPAGMGKVNTARKPDFETPPVEPMGLKAIKSLVNRIEAESVLSGLANLSKGDAVPIAQIQGDLARLGHHIDRLIALDMESRRLFFIDNHSQPLYCEYDGPDMGHQIIRVGFQGEIAKEYDVVDLKPDDSEEWVGTEHEEDDYPDDEPGMIPAGTPGTKPEDSGENFEGDSGGGHGWGDDDAEDDGRRSLHRSISTTLDAVARLIGG